MSEKLRDFLPSFLSQQSWAQLSEHAFVFLALSYVVKKNLIDGGIQSNLTKFAVRLIKCAPGGSEMLEREQNKVIEQIKQMVDKAGEGDEVASIVSLPESSFSRESIIDMLSKRRGLSKQFFKGMAFGGIYIDNQEHEDFLNKAYCLFSESNALWANVFPGVRKMEVEVVKMCLDMFKAPSDAVGCMTSGGTESVIMAVKAYVYRGRSQGIETPEIVMSRTTHPAFAKAAHYFQAKIVLVSPASDYGADPAAYEKAITSRTVMLVGSAPQYPHGIIDPIVALGKVAEKYNVGLHVDACLGGFVAPWFKERGYITKEFDFAVPQVTSISCDIHKYGFGPKGASVVLFRERELRKFMFYAYTEWSGGLYASPSFQGSRGGGVIAASWAAMLSFGREGYLAAADKMYIGFQEILQGIKDIEELHVIGSPDCCNIAFSSDTLDIFKVSQAMANKGWSLNNLQMPSCVHQPIAMRETFNSKQYLIDLRTSVEEVKANPDDFKEGIASIYGMAATVPDRELVSDLLINYLDIMY